MLGRTREAGVCVLTLERPALGNALDSALVDTLLEALASVVVDEALHTLVLRGAGAHFCTGFDLSQLETESDGDLLRRFVQVESLLAELWHLPLRTVVWASGRALGAGADLLTCADVRVATPEARIGFPGARFGLVLGTRRLATRMRADAALTGVAEGRLWSAESALAAGLIDHIAAETFDAWLANALQGLVVDRPTYAALRRATRPDYRDTDLAALVRSAARPGLKARIVAYRESLARR
jgi:enoyl-CoA hydratase/carnithine racemase